MRDVMSTKSKNIPIDFNPHGTTRIDKKTLFYYFLLTQPQSLSISEVKGAPRSEELLGIWVKKWHF